MVAKKSKTQHELICGTRTTRKRTNRTKQITRKKKERNAIRKKNQCERKKKKSNLWKTFAVKKRENLI
jgi:hypothetical protein